MNTNSNIDIIQDKKFDLFHLFEIIKNFKIIVLSITILFCILSILFYANFAKTTKSFEIEIYKYELSQTYNQINTDEIFNSFALSLRDYKVYRDVFKPLELAKAVFASSSYISTQQKFKLIIPNEYISDNNINDFNRFITQAYKQTINKSVLGLEKTLRKLIGTLRNTQLFTLNSNLASDLDLKPSGYVYIQKYSQQKKMFLKILIVILNRSWGRQVFLVPQKLAETIKT